LQIWIQTIIMNLVEKIRHVLWDFELVANMDSNNYYEFSREDQTTRGL